MKSVSLLSVVCALAGCSLLYSPDGLEADGGSADASVDASGDVSLDAPPDVMMDAEVDAEPSDAGPPDTEPPNPDSGLDAGMVDGSTADGGGEGWCPEGDAIPRVCPDSMVGDWHQLGCERGMAARNTQVMGVDITMTESGEAFVFSTPRVVGCDGTNDTDAVSYIRHSETMFEERHVSQGADVEAFHPRIARDASFFAYNRDGRGEIVTRAGAVSALDCPASRTCDTPVGILGIPTLGETATLFARGSGEAGDPPSIFVQQNVERDSPEFIASIEPNARSIRFGRSLIGYRDSTTASGPLRIQDYSNDGAAFGREAGVSGRTLVPLGSFVPGGAGTTEANYVYAAGNAIYVSATNQDGPLVTIEVGTSSFVLLDAVPMSPEASGNARVLYRQGQRLVLVNIEGSVATPEIIATDLAASPEIDIAALSPDGSIVAYIDNTGAAWWRPVASAP